MNTRSFLRIGFAFALCFIALPALHAKPKPAMLEARDNLERVSVLLQQPNVAKADKHENAIVNQLNRALINLGEVTKDKGSQLPAAIKDVEAAQAELAAGDDEGHKAKALEYVKSALKHVQKGWENRGNH